MPAVVALLLVIGMPLEARATDTAIAESLFRDGRALMEAGDYDGARAKLEESYRQDPATGTLLALAVCQEELGLTASAWATYGEAAARAKREGSPERETAARKRKAALEARLSYLTVIVDETTAALDGLVVRRDGAELGQAAWGAQVAIDPGEHAIEATVPGKRAWKATVTIGAERDKQTVLVPRLEDGARTTATARSTRPAEQESLGGNDDVTSDDTGGASLSTIGLVTGGIGIVGLGVGTFFALRAMSLDDDSSAGCNANNVCDDAGFEARTDAGSAADVATIAFIAGGVLTAAGATLFLVGSASEAESAFVEAAPLFGPRTGGMAVHGRF